jgi:SAM-dependent methyltransferase
MESDWIQHTTFWDTISQTEELDYDDEKINRLLRWKALESHLSGVRSILDIGAATGAFSIPLAQMGYSVTHLDLSEEMLTLAKEKAANLPNIQFIQGNAKDLSQFPDNEFDLVLCFDGAISFSGSDSPKVLSEACRVGKKILLSVSSKSCMAATWLNYSLSKLGTLHPSVMEMLHSGIFQQDTYPDGKTLTAIPALKAYNPEELTRELTSRGMRVLECRSIGSLTHLYLLHLYRQFPAEEVHEKLNALSDQPDFLELCDYFDKHVMPQGMGSFRRAGLYAAAEKIN